MAKTIRKIKTNWKTNDNRFVAFIDILGFKDSVLRQSHKDIYEKLLTLSDFLDNFESRLLTKSDRFINAEVKSFNFSDSIILFSKADSQEDFFLFIQTLSSLFSRAMNSNIPLKAAIAYGDITINQEKRIYFGQPLIDAFLLEEDLKCFGITAHCSVDKYVKELENPIFKMDDDILFSMLTPFKHGKTIHTNINWFEQILYESELRDKSVEIKRRTLLDLVEKFRLTTSGSPRQYIDNTLDMIREFYK